MQSLLPITTTTTLFEEELAREEERDLERFSAERCTAKTVVIVSGEDLRDDVKISSDDGKMGAGQRLTTWWAAHTGRQDRMMIKIWQLSDLG
jgi:hypothetical protein